MRKIYLLDCTLRDGGYVNQWRFGASNIQNITTKLAASGVDIIELGYLSTKDSGDADSTRYASIEDITRAYAPQIDAHQKYAVMVNYGEYDASLLPDATQDAPMIRVAFHKKDLTEVLDYFRTLKNKGYHFFVQPMGVQNYSDEEFVQLIRASSALAPDGFYIVDSFGILELKDFSRLLYLADHNLGAGIILGYHSHNNLQQAYSNSKYMIEQCLDHDVVVDASVFGMGRGAGNLNIELFSEYLNRQCDKKYVIEPFLEIFDEYLKPIFAKNFWGYSLPFYLSSIHNCHPNYANYFAEKNTLSLKSLHDILSQISPEDKASFSEQKAMNYYVNYQNHSVTDEEDLRRLQEAIAGRTILILAPGKTIADYSEQILRFIAEQKPVIFGIGSASSVYQYDYLFITNERRKKQGNLKNVSQYIVTSNLRASLPEALCVNYASYLCSDQRVADDPTLMLMNLLIALDVQEIHIAGFDGFSANADDNYFNAGMSMGSKLETKIFKTSIIREQVAKLKQRITLHFLTPSKYTQGA